MNFREERLARNLSMFTVAERCRLSTVEVARAETGEANETTVAVLETFYETKPRCR